MKAKHLFMALLCFAGMILTACESKNSVQTNDNPLANTKWEGAILQTELMMIFTTDECYIQASGYADGVAVGTYKTSQSDLFVTITKTSGSFDSQLSAGDILIGSYDLSAKKITITMTLYGEKRTIVFKQVNGSTDNPDQPNNPTSYSELIIGKWHCTKVYERDDDDFEYGDFIKLVVNADKTYAMDAFGSDWQYGTWTLNGTQLDLINSYYSSKISIIITKLTSTELVGRLGDSQEYEDYYFVRE